MKFFVQTFGCIQNTSDSERIKNYFLVNGDKEVKNWKEADVVVINTCMIRQSAENRAYGLINNVNKFNQRSNPSVPTEVGDTCPPAGRHFTFEPPRLPADRKMNKGNGGSRGPVREQKKAGDTMTTDFLTY